MFMRLLILVLFFVAGIASLAPTSVLAAETCTCYCGDTTNGAENLSGGYDSSGSCKTACETAKKTYVVCSQGTADTPLANAICYTQDECKLAGGIWDAANQPAECPFASVYCFPQPTDATLNVPIGNQTKTLPISDYINLLYTYSLSVAAVIAVVMIMIGGAQYVIGSRGNSEEISKAKDRIKNAIVGLVLLLFAYLILNTVNPALVKFKVLKAPLIKPSIFLQGSCEKFEGQKYKVEPVKTGETTCGKEGNIVSDAHGSPVSDTTCTYEDCSANGAASGCVKSGEAYTCATCDEFGKAEFLASGGFAASTTSCNALTYQSRSGGQKSICQYEAIGAIHSAIGTIFDSLKTNYCARIEVNCSNIKACHDYINIPVYVGGTYTGPIWVSGAVSSANSELKSLCTTVPDICHASDGPCTYNALSNTCTGLLDQ